MRVSEKKIPTPRKCAGSWSNKLLIFSPETTMAGHPEGNEALGIRLVSEGTVEG